MLGKRVVRQLFRVADLLFALGLAALPTLFRQSFGWELQDAFRAHSREVLGRNRSGEALVWSLRSLADLLLVVTLEWLDVLRKDLALSARFCRARSVPDSLQTLTLAVCIATSIGAAGLLNHLVIQPYGYRDVGTLVKFARPISASGASSYIVSLNELRGWQRMEDTFDGIGIWVWREQFHLYRLPGRHLVKSDAKVATRAPRSWPILTACVVAVVGVGLASVAIRWLATTTAADMYPRSASLDISWPVLALGGMVALAAAALVTQRRLWGKGSPGASSGAGRTMQGTWRGAIPVCALALSTCLAIWGGQLLHRT